jgi:hypothetical protein
MIELKLIAAFLTLLIALVTGMSMDLWENEVLKRPEEPERVDPDIIMDFGLPLLYEPRHAVREA